MFRKRKKIDYLASLPAAITPDSTVIAFDLHNVVFKKQMRKIVMHSIKLLPKGTWRYTFNPRVWYRLYKIRRFSQVAEDVFIKMEGHYPGLQKFRGDFITMTNHQRPMRSMFDLIQSLKAQGFSLFILSNIGEETFTKLCAHYPLLKDSFEGAFTARSDNSYVHKPHPEFYESFKKFVVDHGHEGKHILFVDDLKKNIVAAAQCSIASIHFTSPKQLIRTFKKLAILQ